MPTVFGLLNWTYDTLGYGHDPRARDPAAPTDRAFISNYQKIALLRDNGLAILKPKAQTSLYICDLQTGTLKTMEPHLANSLIHDATSYYQSASWLFSSNRLKKSVP
jgi:hypothetical protein